MPPADDFNPAIAALERRLAEHERKASELKGVINVLHIEAGLPPKYPEVAANTGGSEGGAVLTQIKRDSFYGKKQMTAVREYLEMRRLQGNGPATPREIWEALTAGGYQFEAKDQVVALVGLRALLRKSNKVFHKLPGTGTYGLLAWYPDAKPSAEDDVDPAAGAKPKRKGKAKGKRSGAKGKPAAAGNAGGTTPAEGADADDDA